MSYGRPRPLYQTDEDARKIQIVLDLRTKQRDRANDRVVMLVFVVLSLIGMLIGVVA